MQKNGWIENWKHLRIELFVLVFISFLISIISDLEYSSYEQHDISRFTEELIYRLVHGSFNFLLYSSFYWLLLKPLILSGRFWLVLLCLVGFAFASRLASHYLLNWLIIQADFLPADMRARAARSRLYFAVNYLIISVYFPLLGLAFLIRSLRQSEQMKALKEQQLTSELAYLKAQLHPHFFFNTINNIYALALKRSEMTAPMVARLGELMRYILYEANQARVPLRREVEFLRSYIEVEQVRYGSDKDIRLEVQGVEPQHQVEPLLLLPLVENAFKHGLEEERGEGFVRIILCRTEGESILEVVNSKPSEPPTSQGIGLDNLRKRLELLYPRRHQLQREESREQYKAILILSHL